MTATHPRAGHPDENLGEFAEELRLLAEALLERVEPVLRRTASDGRVEWSSCSWCPVCAAAAIVRGEHHDVVAAIAEHGTAIVTVLREALAGVPVDPVIPPDLDPDSPEYHLWRHHAYGGGNPSDTADLPFADAYAKARGEADEPGGGGESDWVKATSARAAAAGPGLGALLARFLAGAQGRAAAANTDRHNSFQAESEDPFGPGPGAARRPADTESARAAAAPDAGADGSAHQPFGPPVAGPFEGVGRPAAARDDATVRAGDESAGRTAGKAGRGGRRAKYVPIDVTIKA